MFFFIEWKGQRGNIWLKIILDEPSTARSVHHKQKPNIIHLV